MMSNTPALVQSGASVFARGRNTHPDDGNIVHGLLSTFGICEEMAEKHMDAVTGLSSSGPGYVCYFINNKFPEYLKIWKFVITSTEGVFYSAFVFTLL